MKGALIEIEGNWAHFKKPETNNNPLTHDFITKTALIGLIGAVLGIERKPTMRALFPKFSRGLLYGVQVASEIKKESLGFKLRRVGKDEREPPRPVYMEFLKNPRFVVAVALHDDNNENASDKGDVAAKFDDFIRAVEASEACFTPVLGLHNCPANLRLKARGEFAKREGEFVTKGFVVVPETDKDGEEQANIHREIKAVGEDTFRIGIDRVPTFQNDDFWNEPEYYRRVAYPSAGRRISAVGVHYDFSGSDDQSKWALI